MPNWIYNDLRFTTSMCAQQAVLRALRSEIKKVVYADDESAYLEALRSSEKLEGDMIELTGQYCVAQRLPEVLVVSKDRGTIEMIFESRWRHCFCLIVGLFRKLSEIDHTISLDVQYYSEDMGSHFGTYELKCQNAGCKRVQIPGVSVMGAHFNKLLMHDGASFDECHRAVIDLTYSDKTELQRYLENSSEIPAGILRLDGCKVNDALLAAECQ